ncbi:TonB-dependent receptor domain-containing protein [Pendulispora albinea]|uniref:TonB-dependent receptor n=1 Tax=Pendulispora albinea TaxID=2741071 RepID=A0ABZ2LLX5_9BACT
MKSLGRYGTLSAAAFAAAMVVVAPARAQQGAAVLTGKVVDAASKKGVADVVVTVTSPSLQGEQIVTTDNTGLYRIPALPPGVYTMHLDKEGYRAYQRDQIQLRADATIRLDADLLPENLEAKEVVVVAHAPTVDVGSTTSGANINSDFTSRIPVTNPGARGGAQRSFESVAEATPGASADLYGTSINGTTSPENSYVIDGLRTNGSKYGVNGSPLSIEFVKEVNVLSGGYMPEYGRSTGGILNVVTKSGSNEYHGSVWANWTPGALEGSRKYPFFYGTSVQTRRSLGNVYDVGFDQSGPIVKDKLWYYVGFGVSRAIYNLDRTIHKYEIDADGKYGGSAEIPGSGSRANATSTSYQLFAKLDYAVNQNNKLALSFAATPTFSGGNGDYSVDPQSGHVEGLVNELNLAGQYSGQAHTRDSGAYDTILKWTSQFDNKSKTIDTTLGWHHETGGTLGADGFGVGRGVGFSTLPGLTYRRNVDENGNPYLHGVDDFERAAGCSRQTRTDADGNTYTVPDCPLQTYRTGGPGFQDRQVLDTYSAKSVLTVLAQGLGHHVIKAGAEFEWSSSWHNRGYSGSNFLQESSDGSVFDVVAGYGYLKNPDNPTYLDRLVTRSNSLNLGGFIQDSWSILDRITLNAGLRYDNQFLFGTDGKLFMSFANQLSPRLGVIFDPTQNGRSKFFASYARFYESVPLNILDRGTGEPALYATLDGAQCNPLDTVQINGSCRTAQVLGPANGGYAATPDRKFQPYAGSKSVIDPDLSPQSMSEFTGGGEYELIKNGRVGVTYVRRWMNNIVEDMSVDEGSTFFIGNPGKGIAKSFPEAKRDYDAGTFHFMKNFADGWLAQASYTLSWLRGNISGLYKAETGQLDPNSNSTFDLRSLLINQTGDLPGDHRHNFKIYGAKDIQVTRASLAQIGASIQARSGAPTNYLGAHTFYGADEVYILPRGSGERLPWNANVGTHLGYGWRFENGMSVSVTMDIFNLFNFQGELATDNRYTRSSVLPIEGGSSGDLPNNLKAAPGRSPFTPAQINPNFGKAFLYQEPRQFRFGVRGTF